VAAIQEHARQQREAAATERTQLLESVSAEQTVWVRRQWDSKLGAAYRFDQLDGLHLSETSGGVSTRTNQLYPHAYVPCDAMSAGELDHSCVHGPAPHRIKVCVVGVDNGGTRSKLMKTVHKLAELGGTR
jgi:hypothetical protein